MVGDTKDARDDDDDEEADDAVSRWSGPQLFPAGALFPVPGGGARPYRWGTEVSLRPAAADICPCLQVHALRWLLQFCPPYPEVGPPGACDKGDNGFLPHSCFSLSAAHGAAVWAAPTVVCPTRLGPETSETRLSITVHHQLCRLDCKHAFW